ncbi:uncharacterized protein LOC108740802 [Agrilus planipennis]|uniref:Uncharacterized protein LOC108740802 n=1 Tax=Agrilus planipennis TaxID=224129 RepID=A0A1W4X3T4_AGRPL|nr:uncharacterized protein LOC108740802 [Agrilus planipennis]
MGLYVLFVAALVCFGKLHANFQDAKIATIVRDNVGDIFMAEGTECNKDTCVGISSGTASTLDMKNENSLENFCECQCHKHLPVFREDLRICVDDIRECSLASFVSSSTSQQIPFVYLPLKGQIIHPSKEIKFTDLKAPVCAVSSAKVLSEDGWTELRNPLDGDIPLRLFRDEGRVFLQWTGNSQQRLQMQGKLILIFIFCREVSISDSTVTEPSTVFTPCVSFRVAGKTIYNNHNITEVSFLDDIQPSANSSFSISEYFAVGICSILLALVYVASVLLYLHMRKKRNKSESKSTPNDSQNFNTLEDGVIKSNPLLSYEKHFPGANSSFTDSSSTVSDNDDSHSVQLEEKRNKKIQTTSALVHLQKPEFVFLTTTNQDPLYQEPSSIEKLPEENVSIVETTEHREEETDHLKAITGNTRKKLYFNPAYFEPQLLMAPPPAAVEFLTKIREVMAIAKQKMASKKFTPSLHKIPEEESFEPIYEQSRSIHSSRKDSVLSLKKENSRRKSCSNCSGFDYQNASLSVELIPELSLLPVCQNCTLSNESKEKSIQRWLEEIPVRTCSEEWSFKTKEECSSIPTKRLRSPTRSLPSCTTSQFYRSLSPKPVSESGKITKISFPYDTKSTKPVNGKIKKSRAPFPPHPSETITVIHEKRSHQRDPNGKHVVDNKPSLKPDKNPIYTDEIEASSVNNNIKATIGPYDSDSLERLQHQMKNIYISSSENISQPNVNLSTNVKIAEETTVTSVIRQEVDSEDLNPPSNNEDLNDDYHLTVLKTVCQKVMDSSFYTLPELLQSSGNKGYNLVSEVYVNNGYNFGSLPASPNHSSNSTLQKCRNSVKYVQPEPGQLLIEVEDCPDNYIKVDEQDFEPDTLDRKPSKNYTNNETLCSENENKKTSKILLKTTGSFKTDNNRLDAYEMDNKSLLSRNFGSLRQIYQEKSMLKSNDSHQNSLDCSDKTYKHEGALLTLEERHAKRQRRFTFAGCSNVPPDVIPPSSHNSLYDFPRPPYEPHPELSPVITNEKLSKNCSQINSIHQKEIYSNCKEGLFCNEFANNDDIICNGVSQAAIQINDLYDEIKIPMKVEHVVYNIRQLNTNSNLSDIFTTKNITKPEDSGYLSTDSNCNLKKAECFDISVENDEGESETDDSLADGQSESGAESVETHSVFFGSYHGSSFCIRDSADSGVGFDIRSSENLFSLGDEDDESDSEAMSYATVVPVESIS